jgi:hypothetical protein
MFAIPRAMQRMMHSTPVLSKIKSAGFQIRTVTVRYIIVPRDTRFPAVTPWKSCGNLKPDSARRPGGPFRQPPFLSNMLFGVALNVEKNPNERTEKVKDG